MRNAIQGVLMLVGILLMLSGAGYPEFQAEFHGNNSWTTMLIGVVEVLIGFGLILLAMAIEPKPQPIPIFRVGYVQSYHPDNNR